MLTLLPDWLDLRRLPAPPASDLGLRLTVPLAAVFGLEGTGLMQYMTANSSPTTRKLRHPFGPTPRDSTLRPAGQEKSVSRKFGLSLSPIGRSKGLTTSVRGARSVKLCVCRDSDRGCRMILFSSDIHKNVRT